MRVSRLTEKLSLDKGDLKIEISERTLKKLERISKKRSNGKMGFAFEIRSLWIKALWGIRSHSYKIHSWKNVDRRIRELEYSFNHHGHCPSCQELVVIPEIGYITHRCWGGYFDHNIFIESRNKKR